jgi:hypothetical protein
MNFNLDAGEDLMDTYGNKKQKLCCWYDPTYGMRMELLYYPEDTQWDKAGYYISAGDGGDGSFFRLTKKLIRELKEQFDHLDYSLIEDE